MGHQRDITYYQRDSYCQRQDVRQRARHGVSRVPRRSGHRPVSWITMLACCVAVPLAMLAVLGAASHFMPVEGAAGAGTVGSGSTGSGQVAWQPSASSAQSTPADQWQKGSVPYLYQIDPQWKSAAYAGSTVEEAGCGPTCLTMAYVALTGKQDYDPPKMSRFSEDNGFVDSGLTTWTLMTEGAAKLGLNSQELPASVASVNAALEAGHPVILTLGPGDFTSTGHFVVVAGRADDGNWIIRDPNSPSVLNKPGIPNACFPNAATCGSFPRAVGSSFGCRLSRTVPPALGGRGRRPWSRCCERDNLPCPLRCTTPA